MGYFIKNSRYNSNSLVVPIGPTSERSSAPLLGSIRYNLDTNSLEYYNGTVFVDIAKAGLSNYTLESFLTDGINDTYTLSEAPASEDRILVFMNGVYQQPGVSNTYTVSGSNLTFTSVPPDALKVVVIHGITSTYVDDSNVFDVPNL